MIVVYTKVADPYSIRAKSLLTRKGIQFTEKLLPQYYDELKALIGDTQTPQIFIHGKHIGSFEELGSLELKGELDSLVKHKL